MLQAYQHNHQPTLLLVDDRPENLVSLESVLDDGERLILTSDLGQYSAAPHPEGLRMILASLLDYGVSRDMLAQMTQANPATLLNLGS